MATPYVSDGSIGADLSERPKKVLDGCNFQKFTLGYEVGADNGSRWRFVQAASAISAGLAVGVNAAGCAYRLTHALAASGFQVAINDRAAFARLEYGFVHVAGPATTGVRVKGSCAKGAALYTTSSAGILDDACSLSGKRIDGIVLSASNTTAVSAVKAAYISVAAAHMEAI